MGFTRGLCGQFTQVYHTHDSCKVIAFHRWDKGGGGDDVVVVANFLHDAHDGYVIGFPLSGEWKLRFSSDWNGYNDGFSNHLSSDITTQDGICDGLPYYGAVCIAPYSVLIYSQQP